MIGILIGLVLAWLMVAGIIVLCYLYPSLIIILGGVVLLGVIIFFEKLWFDR